MKWTIQKAMDEGTAEPFIARLMMGAFELRDQFLNSRPLSHNDREKERLAFDELYEPVFNEMLAMRKTSAALMDLVNAHRSKIDSGEIVGHQRNAIEIHESINQELRDLLSRFLNGAVRDAKTHQYVTAHVGLDIGAFYGKDSNFLARMTELEAAGHKPLTDYLRQARAGWSQEVIDRRNDQEHNGWVLPDIKYPSISSGRVRMVEPQIDGLARSLPMGDGTLPAGYRVRGGHPGLCVPDGHEPKGGDCRDSPRRWGPPLPQALPPDLPRV